MFHLTTLTTEQLIDATLTQKLFISFDRIKNNCVNISTPDKIFFSKAETNAGVDKRAYLRAT